MLVFAVSITPLNALLLAALAQLVGTEFGEVDRLLYLTPNEWHDCMSELGLLWYIIEQRELTRANFATRHRKSNEFSSEERDRTNKQNFDNLGQRLLNHDGFNLDVAWVFSGSNELKQSTIQRTDLLPFELVRRRRTMCR